MADFYISDTHFGHSGIIAFCGRPFDSVDEMDRALIANWNARVREADHVWILGDVVFERDADPGRYLSRLSGVKHLVIGNHDERNATLAEQSTGRTRFAGFFESVDYAVRRVDSAHRKLWMSHYPLMEGPKGTWMLHGHIHNHRNPSYWDVLRNMDMALNCSVEVNGYMPVTFEELVANNQRWRSENG